MFRELNGRRIALLFYDVLKDEAATVTGVGAVRGETLFVEFDDQTPSFEVAPEWLDRIEPVADAELGEPLDGAEFYLSLRVGKLPEDTSPDDFWPIGLKWPK